MNLQEIIAQSVEGEMLEFYLDEDWNLVKAPMTMEDWLPSTVVAICSAVAFSWLFFRPQGASLEVTYFRFHFVPWLATRSLGIGKRLVEECV